MKTKTVISTLAVCFMVVAMGFARNLNMGTWKLNEAQSKIPAGATKNMTVVYAASGDGVKVTIDGVDGSGQPTHNEWTGKFDGKDYPVTGDPNQSSRSLKKVDDFTTQIIVKKDGKPFVTGRIVVSADGKTQTVTTLTSEADGKRVKTTAVYDHQ